MKRKWFGKKFLVALAVLLTAVTVVIIAFFVNFARNGFTSASYQHDADIVRLNDLRAIAGYVEEFRDRAGRYPLQGDTTEENYVFIASAQQKQYTGGGPPYPHTITPLDDFKDELEGGLGKEIGFPFDPQRAPVNKPNFYIYMIRGDTYFVSVHLHQPFSFANEVGPHYYKLEVSNVPILSSNVWEYGTLMKNAEYLEASNRKLHKEEYFDHVRDEQNAKQD